MVMENIRDLYHQYFTQIMPWYNGLELLYQYGVLFLLIAICICLVALFYLSRAIK